MSPRRFSVTRKLLDAVRAASRRLKALIVAAYRWVRAIWRAFPDRTFTEVLIAFILGSSAVVGSRWTWAYPTLIGAGALAVLFVLREWRAKYKCEAQSEWLRTALIVVGCFVAAFAGRAIWEQAISPFAKTLIASTTPTVTLQAHHLTHHAKPKAALTPLPPRTALPTQPPPPMPTPSPTRPPQIQLKPKAVAPIALKDSQVTPQPDGQPMDPKLSVRFINSQTAPASHMRVWLAPIYFDDLPRARTTTRALSQFDPEALGQPPVSTNEFFLSTGYEEVPVDGYRPNHKLSWPGVLVIYVYYIYVDVSGVLHEPDPELFVFFQQYQGFRELSIKDAFPDAWVREELLNMGRQSTEYSAMVAKYGERQ
jgi:hypothetical protein